MGNCLNRENKKAIIGIVLDNIPCDKYIQWKANRKDVEHILLLMWNNTPGYLYDKYCKVRPFMLIPYIPSKYKSKFFC
jgi:hypothetical protein